MSPKGRFISAISHLNGFGSVSIVLNLTKEVLNLPCDVVHVPEEPSMYKCCRKIQTHQK